MDARLVAWARAVKARRRTDTLRRPIPALWLFTDALRLPDPLAAAARLPPGLCGVVLRHDDDPNRAALGRRLRALCRRRRLALVVAGDWRLAWRLRCGLHLRAGRWPHAAKPRTAMRSGAARGVFVTSSAHSATELQRARRRGVRLAFLSPVFATGSHPDAAALGVRRWAALAAAVTSHGLAGRGLAGHGLAVAALGGIDGSTARRLPRMTCAGAGAIGALR
jgi:thiamine-phosphate pyrophosphorylase